MFDGVGIPLRAGYGSGGWISASGSAMLAQGESHTRRSGRDRPSSSQPGGSGIELHWENERFRRWLEALAERHTVLRYDPLGTGLSERQRAHGDFSLEVELGVLERLLDHLEVDRASLFGFSSGGPLAIAYAAGNPERVSRLVLYGTYGDGTSITDAETRRAFTQVVREHWGLGARVLTSVFMPVFMPEEESSEVRWFAELQRESASAETAARLLGLTYELDVSAVLEHLSAPTLVLHRRDDRTIPYRLGLELAAGIPDAVLTTLEGTCALSVARRCRRTSGGGRGLRWAGVLSRTGRRSRGRGRGLLTSP